MMVVRNEDEVIVSSRRRWSSNNDDGYRREVNNGSWSGVNLGLEPIWVKLYGFMQSSFVDFML